MNRTRVLLLSILIFLTSTAIVSAAGGVVPCNGPDCRACDIITLGQNLLTWFIGIMAAITALMFAWGGMEMVMSAGNASMVSSGREKMSNAIIGLIIILASWLIVNTFILVISGGNLSNWGQIQCVANPARTTYAPTTPSNGSSVGSSGGSGAQCATGNIACSPSSLMSAGFSGVQAQVMSCIAMTESSGNPSTPPYNVAHPESNSSACGTFQITKTTWKTVASGPCADFSNCTNAACNAQVAQKLVSKNGYSDWTCANCNAKAQACINKYGG